jgi:ribosomal protein S18 acetylase RimI-like enzyme
MPSELLISPFVAEYQDDVRKLILEGLSEHFGFVDESLNPDLNDIQAEFIARGQSFVVAHIGDTLVGTGALIHEKDNIGRIVRMSVNREYRRRGIGKALVEHLLKLAHQRNLERILIETNNDWDDAIGLYKRCGFVEYHRDDVSVYLSKKLKRHMI